MNRKLIAYVIGKLFLVEALLLLVPLVVALLYHEDAKHVFSFIGTIALTAGIGYVLSFKKPTGMALRARDGAIIVALGWILLSLFGALPFVFTGEIPSLVDAFFETASGFTTTGSSILAKVAPLSKSTLFWRSFTHLVGGMGVLVFTLAILPTDSDSVQLMKAEVPGPVFGKLVSKIRQGARVLYGIYLALTAVFTLILIIGGGVPLYDALLLAFGTAGTGGFAINDAGFSIYANPVFVEYAISIGMLVFGINFNLFYLMMLGQVKDAFKDEELRYYLLIVGASVLAIVLYLAPSWHNLEETFRHVLFTVSSIMTTTGYSTADFATWPVFTHVILMALMIIGACAGSTAGGMKISRIIMYVKASFAEMLRLGHNHRVLVPAFNGKPLQKDILAKVTNYLLVYILGIVVILLCVSIEAPDFLTAFSSVLATFNNIGPGLAQVGPTQNFAFYSDFNKIILSLAMIAGRLEIYPMIVLFAPSTIKKLLFLSK